MKKYSESKRKKPFDWNAFLNKKLEDHTSKQMGSAVELAQDWVTCACGNQCSIIDREEDGMPVDNKLEKLGVDFFDRIEAMENFMYDYKLHETSINRKDTATESINYYKSEQKDAMKYFERNRKMAIKTLAKIEKRSQELINKKLEAAKQLLKDFGVKKL